MGAVDYHRHGEIDVKNSHVYGRTWGGYSELASQGETPWGRPSSRTDGDWTVKLHNLDVGAENYVLETALGAADLAGVTTEGRTQAARSGMKQYGNDIWNVVGRRDAHVATGSENGGSLRELAPRPDTAPGATTAGAPQARLSPVRLAARPVAVQDWRRTWALRTAMAARGIPGGGPLSPGLLAPVIRSRGRHIVSAKIADLNHVLDS
ncbi:hypothetical protein BH23ACT6_BH23ACT6_25820 [soil metagenome]